MNAELTFYKVCNLDDIPRNTGVCALVEGKQIAIFRVGEENNLYAIDNLDPFSKANVLSRGIVGCKDGTPKVASPIHKQQFNLQTGECLDDPEKTVRTHVIQEQAGVVYVSISPG